MQTHGDTDHILKRPMYPGSSYKQNAVKALKKRAKENMRVVMDFDRCVGCGCRKMEEGCGLGDAGRGMRDAGGRIRDLRCEIWDVSKID